MSSDAHRPANAYPLGKRICEEVEELVQVAAD